MLAVVPDHMSRGRVQMWGRSSGLYAVLLKACHKSMGYTLERYKIYELSLCLELSVHVDGSVPIVDVGFSFILLSVQLPFRQQ